MKQNYWLGCCVFLLMALTSCIREENANVEAAIDACSGSNIELGEVGSNHQVVLYVQKGTDLSKLNVNFQLADGATIYPQEKMTKDSVNTYDFTSPRIFNVLAEDGKHSAKYTISAIQTELPTEFHFETLVSATSIPYDEFYEFNPARKELMKWCSGNQGFKLTAMAKSRTDYPTLQDDAGMSGKCLKLVTRDTGSFGKMVKMYLAAGNLFTGSFDLASALTSAPKATKFGFPFYRIPLRLKGYYKYHSGDVFTEKGKEVAGVRDKCDIYAMLYRADNHEDMLDGTNATTSAKIVLLARIKPQDIVESDNWTAFDIPFETVNNAVLDESELAVGQYKLGIVFSSSADGGNFNGAVGSTLYIDEVSVICKE